jgi:hypothetical protein
VFKEEQTMKSCDGMLVCSTDSYYWMSSELMTLFAIVNACALCARSRYINDYTKINPVTGTVDSETT